MIACEDSPNHFQNQIFVIRKWAMNAAGIYLLIYIFLDAYRFNDESAMTAVTIRLFYMVLPFILMITVFYQQARLKLSHNQMSWVFTLAIIIIGKGHAELISLAEANNVYFSTNGLPIILIYSSLLLLLPLQLAIVASLVIIILAAFTYQNLGMSNEALFSTSIFYLIFTSSCVIMNHVCIKILKTNYDLVKIVNNQANTDELTQLYNRRYFYNQSKIIYQNSVRTQTPLALLLIDMDHFKSINDHLGHQNGDKVLTEISKVIQQHCRRPLDLAARLGGDEFVVLLNDTNYEHINEVCRSIIKQVECFSAKIEAKHPNMKLGVSIGVAFNQANENYSIKTLMDMADHAMYRVKNSGKGDYLINDNNTFTETGHTSDLLKMD